MQTSFLKLTIAAAMLVAASPTAFTTVAAAEPVRSAVTINSETDLDWRYERHPEIRKAIDQLERAKADMRNASHDFGGHRADALRACDAAIAQLRMALQYDR